MSIPPLVCSTPPPPEQCEDDKDHEDFDIPYNLSQDDDEDSADYNYRNYSSYNIYETKLENVENEKWDSTINNVLEIKSEQNMKSEEINGVNFITHNQLVKENTSAFEDSIIEDLNLVVDKDIVHSNTIESKECETEVGDSECSDKHTRIQDEGGMFDSIKDESVDLNSSSVNNLNIPNENEILDNRNEDIAMNTFEGTVTDIHKVSLACSSTQLINNSEEITFVNQVIDTLRESPVDQVDMKIKDPEDEFGDFEDFQFTNSENYQGLSVNSENPWESDSIEDPKFGNFTANFDVNESEPNENIVHAIPCQENEIEITTSLGDSNDDFGDFDDFRSSDNTEIITDVNETILTPNVTLWNLHSPDSDQQIVDSVNTVLTSIFIKEIPEPENELLGKLESFLRETWGHLIDIDIRQPYMVNWNNSLGQKTLLKALCIDSRNILFGPKWNYSMPKYAVNLSAAPLQPQKQFTHSNSLNSEPTEKVTNKETGAWVDPFTPDGQESCNTENDSVPTEKPKRPIDLDVFQSETTTPKLSKIYSSTINVQPLRHINLPDTHIFTPTDSETPRSKTIHYDSGPSALIAQTVHENSKSQSENLSSQLSDSVEKEYWDFQDFKGANAVTASTNTNTHTIEGTVVTSTVDSAKTGVTYKTQMLQPIKLDPIIPTLNWPDPGEVKETFDDFSDFISSTSWGNEKENQAAIALDTQKVNQNVINSTEATQSVEDEFETFQSAPISVPAMDCGLNPTAGSQISVPENLTMNVANCDNVPIAKAENRNPKQSTSVITERQSPSMMNNHSDIQEFTFQQTSSGIHNISTDILQPTTASGSGLTRHQHKSDQILQPLSLESYSQINWPNPGIDLQDLSRFNPINSLHSLKSDSSTGGNSKSASPAHNSGNLTSNQTSEDDIWGDFVSSVPKQQQPTPKKTPTFADDDEWTDFVSSPSMKSQNGLNTISFNVHTNLSMQKSSSQNSFGPRNSQMPLDLPTLNYITPKSSNRGIYSEKHFQNL